MRDCRPMIRIGILGAARIAPRGIVTPANELLGAEVTAVASRDLDRARTFASQHSIPLALGSYGELIARDDIDLVYVPLPPSAHLEWCTAALANGKHVLVEKPFANNAQDAAQMVAAARAAATICAASCALLAKGFSTSTCLPLASAAVHHSRCAAGGSGMYTRSTSSRAMSSAYEPKAMGIE